MNLKQRVGEAMLAQALAHPHSKEIDRLDRILGALSQENREKIEERRAYLNRLSALADTLDDASNQTPAGILMKEVMKNDEIPSIPDSIPLLSVEEVDAILYCSFFEQDHPFVLKEFQLAAHASNAIAEFITYGLLGGSADSEHKIEGLPLILKRPLIQSEVDEMLLTACGFGEEALADCTLELAEAGVSDAIINIMAAELWKLSDPAFFRFVEKISQ